MRPHYSEIQKHPNHLPCGCQFVGDTAYPCATHAQWDWERHYGMESYDLHERIQGRESRTVRVEGDILPTVRVPAQVNRPYGQE